MTYTLPLSETWLVPVNEVATAPTGNEIGINGFRVLVNGVGTGAFTGHDNEIAAWNDVGGVWTFETTTAGDAVVDESTGDLYTFDGTTWIAGGGGVSDHGLLDAASLLDDDHPQYLLIDGTRPMTGDLDMDGNQILRATLQKLFYKGFSTRTLVWSDFYLQVGSAPSAEGIVTIRAGAGSGIIGSGAIDKTDHPGLWQMTTGSTPAGRVFLIGSSLNGFHLGVDGITRVGTIMRTGSVLATALQDYTLRFGLLSVNLPNTVLWGVGFEYDRNTFGGNWQRIIVESVGGGTTSEDTGIAVVADTWYALESEVNALGTSVDFFINGIAAGTLAVAANIPSGTGFNIFYNAHIMKLLGTTPRQASVDLYYVYKELGRV